MCQRRISHGTCFEGGIRRKIKEEGEVRDEEERQVGTHIITDWRFPLFSLTMAAGSGNPMRAHLPFHADGRS